MTLHWGWGIVLVLLVAFCVWFERKRKAESE